MDKLQKNFQKLEIDTKKRPKTPQRNTTTSIDSPVNEQSGSGSIYHLRSTSLNNIPQHVDECSSYQYRKKWYQLPRMTALKRNQSMMPINGNGGLKAGTVEPPEPPPQLELNLDWPTNDLIINNKHQSFSTPVSPTPLSGEIKQHKKSSSLSSSTPKKTHKMTDNKRRNSYYELGSSSYLEIINDSEDQPAISPSFYTNNDSYYNPFPVYTQDTQELVINFKNVKPRTQLLKRKLNSKLEQKALHEWQYQLLISLNTNIFPKRSRPIPESKKSNYLLTRDFIIHEFYSTEINYWNQLNYSKVMFCDPLQLAISRNSAAVKISDMDCFANLNGLLRLSSTIIMEFKSQTILDSIHIGGMLRKVAEQMVVFLRCAIDFKANRKLLDQRQNAKGYSLYLEKLSLRKETRQFTFADYLIIPIQRITRYGLLLTDLEKHTEPSHPDAGNIRVARYIVHSLANAMNYAQK